MNKKSPAAIQHCRTKLEKLAERHRSRKLVDNTGIDFTSNDFLAFSKEESIRNILREALDGGIPVGSGGSRLLRGNHPSHEALEHQAAEFFGSEKALYFPTGYAANFALLSTLPQRRDLIVFDALSHASARDGLLATRVNSVKFPHNDASAVEKIIASWRKSNTSNTPWIYVESLYSMDGDQAPLTELVDVCNRFDAMLIVDEAHATGVWGSEGKGFTEALGSHPNVITMHTCGKALGTFGALVCAAAEFIDLLISTSRTFIYSTAPPPMNALAVSEALRLLHEKPHLRQQLHRRIELANTLIQRELGKSGSGSQIVPVIIGSEEETLAIAQNITDSGFDVRAIRPPTVPPGTARLRLSITLHVSESEIENMFTCLRAAMNGKS